MSTKIQWATEVWNPTVGCTKVSEGCLNCYITTTMPFRTARWHFDRPGIGGTTGVRVYPERLLKPFSWPAGQRVFVNSLSDLMHEAVATEFVAQVFAVMSLAQQHTFLLLTKRHGRLRSLLSSAAFTEQWLRARAELAAQPRVQRAIQRGVIRLDAPRWPVPNVWVGVSVESQRAAELRISSLLDTPAALRWLSCEPLVGPVDLGPWLHTDATRPALDWVVIGGESGHGARRMAPSWADYLLMQCAEVALPVFYKQAGAVLAAEWGCQDRKGGDPAEWPTRFPREFPLVPAVTP